MSNISQKLTYLNDTKTKLKNVINYAGGNITNDTFRSYPEKLYDKFVDFVTNGTDSLYSSLPKVTGERTELTLSNTANGVLKLDFKGNTSQDGEPTPENPQDIHVVTGDNDVKIENRNLAQHIDGHINASGVFKVDTTDSFYFPVTQGETYIYNNSGNRDRVAIFNSIPTNNQTCIEKTNTYLAKNKPFVASATGYMVIYANTPTSETVKNDFIVVKGNTIGNYTPHQEQTYRVDFGGKNKFDKENTQWYKNNNSAFINTGNTNTTRIRTTSFKISGGKTYTISGIPSEVALNSVRTYEEYEGTQTSDFTKSGNTFTLGENVKYIHLLFSGENFTDETNELMKNADIQIEEGTEATRYSRYVENPIELCKIGEYEDKLFKNTTDNPLYNADLELNKWYKYGAIGKLVLDENTNVILQNNDSFRINTNLTSNILRPLNQNIAPNVLSNYLKPITWAETWADKIGFISGNSSTNDFRFRVNANMTLGELQSWLSTHNIIIDYICITPTYTLLDDTLQEQLDEIYYNAVSYEDQTNISQTNADLPFVIGASAIKKYSE